ncbi:hypothetical protein BKA62DRAFT_824503 [Auriculariales sp. MPI-PUGE-AT-0066]|nr:hypothetical protein BKA62DRAFT_824503 [Auriculariales sp. MPI-PUGE-AT-0066]
MSMSNIISPRMQTHQRLPSDEVKDSPAASSTELVPSSKWKGKGRAVEPITTDVESDLASRHSEAEDEEEGEESSELDAGTASYPPTTEDKNESRRIAENLRRWEAAERDKRRAARESKHIDADTDAETNTAAGGARGSWYLWNRQSAADGRSGGGAHNPHQLLRGNSHDDGTAAPTRPVSIDETDEPATPMPNTPGLSPATPTPTRVDTSPFSDVHAAVSTVSLGPALMEPSASVPTTPRAEPPPERPVLQATHASAAAIPLMTDEPFKTPPPRIVIPGQQEDEGTELPNRSQDQQRRHQDQLEWQEQGQKQRQGRWWTDWLCGCREDRHREQGGATNPFE